MSWEHQELTGKIIAAAIEVHKHLGPGLLEIVYQTCLAAEMDNLGIKYQREVSAPLIYKNRPLECGFRVDFLVEGTVILELKAVDNLLLVHKAQLLSYLHLMNKPLGLLLNFNTPAMKEGIHRFVLGEKVRH